jgi:DNA-binding protein H-NS
MTINLEQLSIAELDALIDQAAEMIEKKKAQAVLDAKSEIQRIAATTGMSVEELLGLGGGAKPRKATTARKPVAIKYRNPKDHTQTWTGRGKRPQWVQEMLNAGAKLENLMVR